MKERVYIQDVKHSSTIVYPLQNQEHRISTQDILYITVGTLGKMSLVNSDAPQVNGGELLFYLNGYSVDKKGELILPEIGSVYVLGKTLDQVRNDIQLEVDLLYKDAVVNVKTAGIKVNVLGEVTSPGKYTFYQNQVTIFDVLSMSGDLTDFANRKEVKILRHQNNTVTLHELDLTSSDLLSSEFYLLQPNDVVYVEPLKAKVWGLGETGWQTFQTLLTTLSSTFLIINYFNN
tara:strand:+ start:1392 stop:2090 length:699 start_codon:yes stop_codon:yes gene_type:complete